MKSIQSHLFMILNFNAQYACAYLYVLWACKILTHTKNKYKKTQAKTKTIFFFQSKKRKERKKENQKFKLIEKVVNKENITIQKHLFNNCVACNVVICYVLYPEAAVLRGCLY